MKEDGIYNQPHFLNQIVFINIDLKMTELIPQMLDQGIGNQYHQQQTAL